MYEVSTFYSFFSIDEDALLERKAQLLTLLQTHEVRGTILIAAEGINATLCARHDALQTCMTELKNLLGCDFAQTLSDSPIQAFGKAKVRIKPTLVKLGQLLDCPECVGTYVEPADWNDFISRDDVVVIDTRNSYETYLGTFKGSIAPDTRKFNHLPSLSPEALGIPKNAKIATFCTGGIRCEKYTAWLKQEGYDDVYHLKGGILRYLAETPEAESLWEGSCYVFDDRVAVKHGLAMDEDAQNCPACGHTLVASDLRMDAYIPGERCAHCATFPPANYDLLERRAALP